MDWASVITTDIARLLQYAGASVLFGTALFNLMSLPGSGDASASRQGWPKPLFLGAGIALLVGAALSLVAQSCSMNGIPLSKLDAASVRMILVETQWGQAVAVRIGICIIALAVALGARPSASIFVAFAAIGLISLASFAFTGHGASDEGASGMVHLVADMTHSIAAGVWLGALAGFFILLRRSAAVAEPYRLALVRALTNFATTGSVVVGVLIVTGIINTYFLIGVGGLTTIFSSAYGSLLALKLVLFASMLGLAAINRFRLTPALAHALDAESRAEATARLRRSVTLETLAGLAILALVAIFGMLEPPGPS